ncbi:MAG: DUF2442 domain-containing protein [Reyranellaceae bacterium]|jgi:hypothetical protein
MVVTERELARAEARLKERRQAGYATSARYDRRSARVVVMLNTGVQVAFPAHLVEGLSGASSIDLSQIEISPAGLGLHWPRLDADVYVPALLQGVLGSKSWMARQLGSKGGQARTEAKRAAARENGRKGGRPRKIA